MCDLVEKKLDFDYAYKGKRYDVTMKHVGTFSDSCFIIKHPTTKGKLLELRGLLVRQNFHTN